MQVRTTDEVSYRNCMDSCGLLTVDLNAGPDELEWIAVGETSYAAVKSAGKYEPWNKDGFWRCDPDQLVANKIPFRIVAQRVGDIVHLN